MLGTSRFSRMNISLVSVDVRRTVSNITTSYRVQSSAASERKSKTMFPTLPDYSTNAIPAPMQVHNSTSTLAKCTERIC